MRKRGLCVTIWGCVRYPPMKAVTLGLMMPLGRRWKSYSTESTTTVCPALLPPCRGESGTQTRHREFRPVGVLLALRSEVKAFCYDSFLPLSWTAGPGFCTFTDRFAGLFLQSELVFLMPYRTVAVRLRHHLHLRCWLNFKPLITTMSLKHLQTDLSMCSDHAGYFWPFQ